MNQVSLIGRLTNDPKISYGGSTNTCVAKFNLAVNRDRERDKADYPSCVAFGKTAELMEKYCVKGQMIGITGRIQTGSYEKDGRKVYTTDVIIDHIEFLTKAEKKPDSAEDPMAGFSHADDLIF